jgi:hypothetical protein
MLAERIAKKLPLCGCSGTLVQNLLRTLLTGKDPAPFTMMPPATTC